MISFIIFTALFLGPIRGGILGAYTASIGAITRLENWPTLEKYNRILSARIFFATWVGVYWFTVTLVFVIARFGPAITMYRYQRCRGVQQQFLLGYEVNETIFEDNPDTILAMNIIPVDFKSAYTESLNEFLNLLFEHIPGADYPNSPGNWDPTNPLVSGLWIGCVFGPHTQAHVEFVDQKLFLFRHCLL